MFAIVFAIYIIYPSCRTIRDAVRIRPWYFLSAVPAFNSVCCRTLIISNGVTRVTACVIPVQIYFALFSTSWSPSQTCTKETYTCKAG